MAFLARREHLGIEKFRDIDKTAEDRKQRENYKRAGHQTKAIRAGEHPHGRYRKT